LLLSANEILLFLAFAGLTGLVLWLLLRPLRADAYAAPQDVGESEIAIYRDQLAEIGRDLDRGTIGEAEAEAARVEVSRRLIAAGEAQAEAASRTASAGDPRWRRAAAVVLALGLPMLTLFIYLGEGAPGLEGQPIEARLDKPASELPVEALIVRIERRLKENPDDVTGWETIAPAYVMLGRYDEAVRAWTRAMIAGGMTAERLAARGEARVLANEGSVGAGAKADLEKAIELEPMEPRAQYLLGLAELEEGNREAALTRWKTLLASAPDDAAWASAVRGQIDAVEGRSAISAEDEPMIRGMVEGLAARLQDDPDDLEGWIRLIRSYEVLQDSEKARAALETARKTFADDAEALSRLDNLSPGGSAPR
jgi:cytochrome c-type biogenesis protein CcmH